MQAASTPHFDDLLSNKIMNDGTSVTLHELLLNFLYALWGMVIGGAVTDKGGGLRGDLLSTIHDQWFDGPK